ncbi:MAG: hypothetical protein CSA55_04905 [Ilumatobacter coccineus]|uniref:Uncharacterized protein n=1 Tax=Ilumatobacter coccineus TaxID=467094 RepID=A0A2G6K7U8_9ACTN|nr:MAG: hypothetical protein CSA55_04905 [Ilumatobacter coccineus]
MLKRVTWFSVGMAVGSFTMGMTFNRIRRRMIQLAPPVMARSMIDRTRSFGWRVLDAVKAGRLEMESTEAGLKARRDHHVEPIDDRLEPGDQVLVDGRPVDASRIVVVTDR